MRKFFVTSFTCVCLMAFFSEPAHTLTTDNESLEKTTIRSSVFADVKTDTAKVGNTDELKAALKDSSIHTIELKDNIDLGNKGFPVNQDIIIDGKGHTLTYHGTLATQGIYFNKSNITIHYRNINFGFKDALGNKSTTNANNYYGIAPSDALKNGLTLIVENVAYFSDFGAQPLFLNQSNDKIIFRGTNEFTMKGAFGTNSQEFAEAANLIFDEGSVTNVLDENMDTIGFIWSFYAPLAFNVAKNATVNITTSHDFIYSDSASPKITIGEGGSLKIQQSDKTAVASKGQLIYQGNKALTIDVAENANLDIRTKNTSQFSKLTANFGINSTNQFSVGSGTFMNAATPVDFTLDNINSLTLNSENASKNVFATNNGSIKFKELSSQTKWYDVFVNKEAKPLTSQEDTASWKVNTSNFSRPGSDFTEQTKQNLHTASQIKIAKQNDKPTVLSWQSDKIIDNKNVELVEKKIANGFSDSFYWQDLDTGDDLVFQLWSKDAKISDITEVSGQGQTSFSKIDYHVAKETLSIGKNDFYIKVFNKRSDGHLILMNQLSLALTIKQGALSLDSVPKSLDWLNRKISETKGILARDSGNTMSFKVSDTRLEGHAWNLTASVKGTRFFSLLWKDGSQEPTDLNGQVVFSSQNTTSVDDVYSKSWDVNSGVLMKSDDYIPVGDHSNDLTIIWTLNDVESNIK